MARKIVELDKPWEGPLPQLAWIVGIGPIPGGGQGIGFAATAGRTVTGPSIDMAAELARGPGNKSMKVMKGSNKARPSALSLCSKDDYILGIVLDDKLDASFDALPFSGGYVGADSDYLGMVLTGPKTAYIVVPASRFGETFDKPFNIHLDILGKYGDGQGTFTQIILDPDTRYPPPGLAPDG